MSVFFYYIVFLLGHCFFSSVASYANTLPIEIDSGGRFFYRDNYPSIIISDEVVRAPQYYASIYVKHCLLLGTGTVCSIDIQKVYSGDRTDIGYIKNIFGRFEPGEKYVVNGGEKIFNQDLGSYIFIPLTVYDNYDTQKKFFRLGIIVFSVIFLIVLFLFLYHNFPHSKKHGISDQ